MQLNKNFILLLVGIVFFLLGFLSLIFVDKESEKKYKNIIQRNLSEAISKARADQSTIEKLITENSKSTFGSYEIETAYPYYIFRGDSLVYWSTNKDMPTRQALQEINPETFHKSVHTLDIFVNSSLKDNVYKIISVINLYQGTTNLEDFDKSGLNYSLFFTIPAYISNEPATESFKIAGTSGQSLFYVKPVENPQNLTLVASKTTLTLFCIGIILISWFFSGFIKTLILKDKYLSASLNLILLVLFIRLWMLFLGLPWRLLPEGFLPENLVNASGFGDIIFSTLCLLLVLAFLSLWEFKAFASSAFKNIPNSLKSVLSVLTVIASLILVYLCYKVVYHVYSDPSIGLNYSMRFYLTNFRLSNYIYLFSVFGIFFLGLHIFINLFGYIHQNFKPGFFHWLYGVLVSLLLLYYFRFEWWITVAISFYFLLTYMLNFPRYFYILRFKTLIYLLSGAFAFTLILFSVIINLESEKALKEKSEFAEKMLLMRDIKAEALLDQFNITAHNDQTLIRALERPILAYESIKYIVNDSLLDPYFDGYDLSLFVYNFKEDKLNIQKSEELNNFYKNYAKPEFKTEYEDLYYIRNPKNKNAYILFSDLTKAGKVLGRMILTVQYSAADLANTIDKLSDKGLQQEPDINNYSYILYDNAKHIIYKQGSFHYTIGFSENVLNNPKIFENGLRLDGYEHFALRDSNGNTAIVSHSSDFYMDKLSSFSYLFLISLIAIVFLLIFLGLIRGFGTLRLNFSSKIQLYLNLAFLVPFTIIILLTLTVVISSFVNIQKRSLLENSTNISNTIDLHYQNLESGKSSVAYFEEQINSLAKSSDFDINIYDKSGRLKYTSTPGYYQRGKISGYINPLAYISIISKGNSGELLDENMGALNYKTAYLPGKGLQDHYGIIGVSYADSDVSLEKQIKEVVAIILIIFFIMFVILLALSYTASTNLTEPLRLVAQKLKKTNLNEQNEEIIWKSNDEIGLLTTEYNRMIKKLEESKEALSASEKQTAWREMARQVAHEIKNPLTPMKLSIQQLQRTLPAEDTETKIKVERALASINEQIDNISEIANSFSEFAKMPVPRTELFDLVSTVQNTVYLYSQNNNVKINFSADSKEIMVSGDRMILSRAVTNLIINGIQSVPATRKPIITVIVSDKRDMGMIEVKDNGTGIPEEVRKRVFIPNFSTKVNGSGLGLSMAKRGIEHAGGNIWFESVEGEGTTFYLDLPKTSKNV